MLFPACALRLNIRRLSVPDGGGGRHGLCAWVFLNRGERTHPLEGADVRERVREGHATSHRLASLVGGGRLGLWVACVAVSLSVSLRIALSMWGEGYANDTLRPHEPCP